MKEVIYNKNDSYFEVPPGILKHKAIRVEPTKDTISVIYGLKSPFPIEKLLELRPQLSQLVQGIFGNGFQTYDTELYQVVDNGTKLVGFIKSRIQHLSGRPLLVNPSECVLLIFLILKSQLQHKSSLVDGLFAAMSKANMGGFVNTAFAWAWWGFEWLIQHLEKKNPAPRKLDIRLTGHNGKNPNLRKYFKKQIQTTVKEYEKEIMKKFELKDSQTIRFNQEIKGIKQQINNTLLKPTFMEMYENQIPFLSNTINSFLSFIKLSPLPELPSEKIIRTLFKDWTMITEEIVKPAKVARDGGFHVGKYTGLLEGEKFDIYNGMMKFVGWVCTLLSIILTRSPHVYDPECKMDQRRFELASLPEGVIQDEKPNIPSEGVLEWTEYKNGEVVKHTTPVSQVLLRDNWTLEFLPEDIPKASSTSCLIDMRKPRSADLTFKAEGVQIKGAFEFDKRTHNLRIHKFLSN